MITYEEASELFDYDPETGIITNKFVRSNSLAGNEAGGDNGRGYKVICVNYKKYKSHRMAWLLYYKEWPDGNLDHIDRNKSNNRINNLRILSVRLNRYNTNIKFSGVSWHKRSKGWCANTMKDRKHIYLGFSKDKAEAEQIYQDYLKTVHT